MAGPSAKQNGFWNDITNSRLYRYALGTAVDYITSTGVTILSGKTLAVTTADKLTVGGVIVPQELAIPSGIIDATYDQDRFVWTAPWACQVTGIKFQQSAIESTSSTTTVMPKKVASGTAVGSGTDLLAAALNLKTGVTANTNLDATLNATAGNLQLAAGDSLGLDFTNALTEYVGCCTFVIKRI
jgi:hypothetical protein